MRTITFRLSKGEIEALASYHDFQEAAASAIGEESLSPCVRHHRMVAERFWTIASAPAATLVVSLDVPSDGGGLLLEAVTGADVALLRSMRAHHHVTAIACAQDGAMRRDEEAKVALLDRLMATGTCEDAAKTLGLG